MLHIIVLAAFVSWGATTLLLYWHHSGQGISQSILPQWREREVQRYHAGSTPRLGGFPIVLGFAAGLAWSAWKDWAHPGWFGLVLLCIMPAWVAGMWEDVVRRASVGSRLRLTLLAAGLAVLLIDARLVRFDLPYIDAWLLQWPLLSVALTIVALGGLPHAMNIIDGFNGLAGMVALMILSALGYVAFKLGDSALLAICLSLGASTVGFFVWNYPRGLIFAGDGGAYLWGAVIGLVAVLLVARHPDVSPWFPMLLCIYPVWETLFSAYRKGVLRRRSPMQPDGLHLHMLVYKRLVRWMVCSRDARQVLSRNSLTAPYLWAIALASVVPATLFWNNTPVLVSGCVVFVALYLWLYRKLIRFRAPKVLLIHRGQTD
ncbi:MAG: glycosyl transferase [Rhodocyclaceae bacterium]|nr:glycosyl transferase [Rhodocyclaceae bacterium]